MKCPICNNPLVETVYGFICKSNGEAQYELYSFNKMDINYCYDWFVFDDYCIKRMYNKVILYVKCSHYIIGKNEDWPFIDILP